MKTAWKALLLIALLGTGCVSTTWFTPPEKCMPEVAPVPRAPREFPRAPPVTVNQVNETNAREMARALRDEFDRENP